MARVGQEITEFNGHTFAHTQFESGNKLLTLTIDVTMNEANTRLNTIEGRPKVLGATTQVYTEARDVIQLTANQSGRPILYEFCTLFPSMISWASDPEKGARIFGWDAVNPRYHRFVFRATKTLSPGAA